MTLVIDNVRIVDGSGAPPMALARVVVDGERITAAGPREGAGPYGAPIEIPRGAEVIDGTGKTVLPGLIDVHVHDPSDANMALYVRSGVTAIRFAGGNQRQLLQLRDRIERGEVPGPRVFSCGHALDATPHAWPGSYAVDTPLEARRVVRRAITDEHADAILATHRVTKTILASITDEAHTLGTPVTGQIWSASARDAAESGIDGLENTSRIPEDPAYGPDRLFGRLSVSARIATLAHLWVDADPRRLEEIAGLLAERGVWIAPELVSFEAWAGLSERAVKADRDWPRGDDPLIAQYDRHNRYISSEWTQEDFAAQAKALDAFKEFLNVFVAEGGAVTAGTDLGFGGILLQRELAHFLDAGLTPLQTIRSATRAAASALGRDDLGAVSAGRTADLILVDGDPSGDLKALREVDRTIIGGRVVYQHDPATERTAAEVAR